MGENLWPDPDYAGPVGGGWTIVPGPGYEHQGAGVQGGYYFAAQTQRIDCAPGQVWRLGATRTNIEGAGGQASLYARFHRSDYSQIAVHAVARMLTEGYSDGAIVVPADAAYFVVGMFVESNMQPTTRVRLTNLTLAGGGVRHGCKSV